MQQPEPEVDTVAGIADSLRDDPVLVHELLGNGRTDEVREALTGLVDDLATDGVPAYVALVQRPNVQLSTDQSADDLLRLVHAELDEPGLYVVAMPREVLAVATYDVPLDATMVSLGRYDALDAARADLSEGEFVSSAGEAALTLRIAADDDHELDPGQVDDLLAAGPWVAAYGDEPMAYELRDAQGEPETPLVVAVACALVVLVLAWRLLRARSALASGKVRHVLDATRPADRRERAALSPQPAAAPLQKQARRAVGALRRDVGRARAVVTDEVHGCLEAAERLVDSGDRFDAIGALVLAEQGTARLRGDELPVRCYFDPLHGASARTVAVSGVSLPACADCAAALGRGAEPRSLRDDADRPYWRGRTVWAETGFGSIDPDLWRFVQERAR